MSASVARGNASDMIAGSSAASSSTYNANIMQSHSTSRDRENKSQELSVHFDNVTDKNIQQLRILNNAILPVRYQDKFYKDILKSDTFTQLAYYTDVLIGALCSRIEPLSETVRSHYKIALSMADLRCERNGTGVT